METRNSKFETLKSYLELMRPANVVTAWADVLAGAAVAGFWVADITLGGSVWAIHESPLLWLVLATTGLYAGGVVLNDFFDAELDATERPERAIPSGRVSRTGAGFFGMTLLLLGMGAAFQANNVSGWIAVLVGLLAVIYDRFGKHSTLFGPLNMGLCRAGNLLLGVSLLPSALEINWPLAFIPLIYIGAITAISRGEVHGGSIGMGKLAVGLIVAIIITLSVLFSLDFVRIASAGLFIVFFAWLVLPSFLKAAKTPEAANIKRAVRAGILGLIPLNAAIAAGFAAWPIGLAVLLLLPLSIGLARLFAMT